MGLIGYYGKDRFEVSGKKIYTFDNFQRNIESRYQTFDRIGRKPLTERTGPGLQTISFDIICDIMHGVNPRKEVDHWTKLANDGSIQVLVIGGKQVSKYKWLLKSAAENWSKFAGDGTLLTATINLTFEEYAES